MMIAFYYGYTGFSCVWYFRTEIFKSGRDFFMKGLIPLLGGVMLFGGMVITDPGLGGREQLVVWHMQFAPHWQIGFAFILGVGSYRPRHRPDVRLLGLSRPFFRGETLNRDTPIFLADDAPITAGLDAARLVLAGVDRDRVRLLEPAIGRHGDRPADRRDLPRTLTEGQRPSKSGWRGSHGTPPAASWRRRAMPDNASSTTRLARNDVISAWS